MLDSAPNRLKSWFSNYVSSFYTGDEEFYRVIQLKKTHTARVSIGVRRLGRALNLGPCELRLAEIIGLLHDVGRFGQYARHRTFRDRDSENHGKLGLRVIGRHGLLSGFNPCEKRHIARAVALHNAARLPALTDASSLFFLKLIRDADKLDIWKVAIGHYNGCPQRAPNRAAPRRSKRRLRKSAARSRPLAPGRQGAGSAWPRSAAVEILRFMAPGSQRHRAAPPNPLRTVNRQPVGFTFLAKFNRAGSCKLDLEAVRTALARTGGNKARAAKIMGVGRATLYRFLNDHPELA